MFCVVHRPIPNSFLFKLENDKQAPIDSMLRSYPTSKYDNKHQVVKLGIIRWSKQGGDATSMSLISLLLSCLPSWGKLQGHVEAFKYFPELWISHKSTVQSISLHQKTSQHPHGNSGEAVGIHSSARRNFTNLVFIEELQHGRYIVVGKYSNKSSFSSRLIFSCKFPSASVTQITFQ